MTAAPSLLPLAPAILLLLALLGGEAAPVAPARSRAVVHSPDDSAPDDGTKEGESKGTQLGQYLVEIHEDRKGHLWFGTIEYGVARFDGEKLEFFTDADLAVGNVVASIAEEPDGTLWFGTHEGICRYDGKQFTKLGAKEGLPTGGGGVRTDPKGVVWASMDDAVYRFDGKRFHEFPLPIDRAKISSHAIRRGSPSLKLIDRAGRHWFSVDGYGVLRYDGKTFTHLSQADGLCSNQVSSILEDREGRIWFTCIQSYTPKMTGDGGLCRYDGKKFERFPKPKGLAKNDLYTIYEDPDGTIWIGASGTGVYRYDGTEFTLLPKTNRMDLTYSLGLQAAHRDRHGTLWLGFSGGLFRVSGNQILNVTREDFTRGKARG